MKSAMDPESSSALTGVGSKIYRTLAAPPLLSATLYAAISSVVELSIAFVSGTTSSPVLTSMSGSYRGDRIPVFVNGDNFYFP